VGTIQDDIKELTTEVVKARRDQVLDTLHAVQADFKTLTLELMVREFKEKAPSARYLELSTNSNYENGTFWELDDVLNEAGAAIFEQDSEELEDLADMFNTDYAGDYTDFFAINEREYFFDLSTRETIESVPVPAASI
jgi:hypothetical protein